MVVISTEGRIGSIECDEITFYNGQAVLWLKDEEGTSRTFRKLPIEKISIIINYSSKEED